MTIRQFNAVAWVTVVACMSGPTQHRPPSSSSTAKAGLSAPARSTDSAGGGSGAAGPASALHPIGGKLLDHLELPEEDTSAGQPVTHPLDGWTTEQLERALLDDPVSLGSMSIGSPSGGALFNGVQMPVGPLWRRVDPAHAWATQETISYLTAAIEQVHQRHPGGGQLRIGHLSARSGGPLAPHLSHQSGRDVDVGYYYLQRGAKWYVRASSRNLDRTRTWALIRALLIETDVQLILIDRSLQALLRAHTLAEGEDADWLRSVFDGEPGGRRAIIRHAPGHATHIHIRFYNPIAQETGRRMHGLLVKHGKIEPIAQTVRHRVRKGETLGKLARKYGTTVQAIRKANHLRSTVIRAGRVYRIPRPGGLKLPIQQVVVPPRRLPPQPRTP